MSRNVLYGIFLCTVAIITIGNVRIKISRVEILVYFEFLSTSIKPYKPVLILE